MQVLDSAQTAARLPFDKLIPAIEKIFQGECAVPRRHIHTLPGDGDTANTLLIMPAWVEGQYLGIKHVTVYPGNGRQGLPGLHSTYTLFDVRNGRPLAFIDGDQITVRRTAAASALAARFLAKKNARRLLVVGAGNVASALAPAYAAVRDIAEVKVWNHAHAKAEALAGKLREQGFSAQAIPDLEAGVREADIVTCATLSKAPLIRRAWLRPGTHVDLIGGFTPEMRESDDAMYGDTSVFVDTDEALDKAGDLLSPMAAGVLKRADVLATLEDLCRRKHPGRTSEDEITVYKCVGNACEDLAAAVLAYQS
jgi:ornithine cyclodeaminase